MISIVLLILTVFLHPMTTEDNETYLENFDRRILQELKHPLANNGKYLYQNMLRYYSDLLDMFNMIKTRSNVKVNRYVRGLIDSGGPEIFKYPFDPSKLEVTYNWTRSDRDDFTSAFSKAKELWGKIDNTTFSGDSGEESSSDGYSYSDDSEKDDYSWTVTKVKT